MSGYSVVIEKISEAGRAATRVADGLRGVNCAGTVPGGDAGMPGARCIAKLAAVRHTWQGRERAFTEQLDGHAESMATAAQRYRGNEDDATQDLSPTGGSPAGGRRPV